VKCRFAFALLSGGIAMLLPAGARGEDWAPLWSTSNLSQARSSLSATSAGNKVFFGGGYTGSASNNVVDIYDTSTGAWSTATLSQARQQLAATSAGGQVFFGGGQIGSSGSTRRVVVSNLKCNSNAWFSPETHGC